MRRLLAASALAVVVLTGAACSKSEPSASSTTPSATNAATTPAAAAGSDNKTICAQVNALIQQEVTKYSTNMDTITKQLQSGDMSKLQAAADQLKQFFNSWATDLENAASNAADPNTKKALTDLATLLRNGSAQVNVNSLPSAITLLNSADFSAAGAQLDKVCSPTS